MKTQLLLGDEAVALGAVHAGIAGAFSYPGTPATEIMEAVQAFVASQPSPTIWAQWSANEKVAYEEALGMSYAGKRALVAMKHVGLNVAADPFVNSALTGVNGGLVLVVADDPGMHSSQNEQDTRYLAEFAKVPFFEPGSQQAAYDMAREAFELSERLKLPVVLRLVTRLAHSRANVRPAEPCSPGADGERLPPPDPNDWTLVPANARRRFRRLLDLQPEIRDYAAHSLFNRLRLAGKRGIVCSGIAANYVHEALDGGGDESVLEIGAYPIPVAMVRDLVAHCDEILVIEEGYPYIEERIGGLLGIPGKTIRGKLKEPLQPDGELTPEGVAAALGRPLAQAVPQERDLVGRAPQLCQGCPHADTFRALVDATAAFPEATLFSDIGCYTLGALPPYRAVHSCVDMGASISMAHGASEAGSYPVLCTIGDSTFTHSGMTPLIGAVRADADMTVIILDNATVAMTGAQETMASGEPLISLLKGLGVARPVVFEPLPKRHDEMVRLLREAIEHRGLSVLVARRACIQIKPTKPVAKEAKACGAEIGSNGV